MPTPFRAELMRHAVLVAAAVAIVLLLGLPLGSGAFAGPDLANGFSGPRHYSNRAVDRAVRTADWPADVARPSAPLGRRNQIAGIGTTPAVIALVLYGLLPLVRNTIAGLEAVSPAVIDAARGNGMRDRQILVMVTLPLALPVILPDLQIVSVQTVGLAVVAAPIGARRPRHVRLPGLGQNAIDLVMLGVLPTITIRARR